MQADRVGGGISNPQSMNRYAYAINDAVDYTDHPGLDWFSDWLNPANADNFANGAAFANWITNQQDMAFFGNSYYDLPGNANDIQSAMSIYMGMVSSTYQQITDAQAAQAANAALAAGNNATAYAIMAGNPHLQWSDDPSPSDRQVQLPSDADAKAFADAIAELPKLIGGMSTEKKITTGLKKGFIMNMDGTVHTHSGPGMFVPGHTFYPAPPPGTDPDG